MKLAIVSTIPPTPCGIAEYTSMLLKELVNILEDPHSIKVYSDISGVKPKTLYREPYTGLLVKPAFKVSNEEKYDQLILPESHIRCQRCQLQPYHSSSHGR